MWMGSSPTGVSTVKTAEGMVGRKFKYHRSFTSGDLPGSFQKSPCSSDPANGWRSGYSFVCADNARATAIASGAYDERFEFWIRSVPIGHKVDFAFSHEANAKLDSMTLSNQIAAYQRAAQVWAQLRSAGVQQVTSGNVALTLCLTNYNWNSQSATTKNRYNPIIEVVDLLALDIYGGALGPGRRWGPNSEDFRNWWTSTGDTVGTGRLGLWETSANDSGTPEGIDLKVQWIEQSTQGMYDLGAEMFSTFHSTVNGSQPMFNRQVYADAYRNAIDAYGATTGAGGSGPGAPPPSDTGIVFFTAAPLLTLPGVESSPGVVASLLIAEIFTPVIDEVPSAVTVSVINALGVSDIVFTLHGQEIFRIEPDSDGGLELATIPIPDLKAGGVHLMQPGMHTLTVTQGSASGTVDFKVLNAPSTVPEAVGPDAAPVLVPGSVQPTGFRRWVFQDPMPGGLGSWILPMNPVTADSPPFVRELTAKVTTAPEALGGQSHVFEDSYTPVEWSLEGVCPTEEHREMFEAFHALNRRWYLHDHRGRAWKVTSQSFEAEPRLTTNWQGDSTDQFFDYTATLLVMERGWVQL